MAESGDPSDPLCAPAVEAAAATEEGSPSDVNDEDEEDEVEEDDEGGGPPAEVAEGVMDEATSGFLDKVNSGTINSAQFMPAIVDLPETVVKKRRPRKPKAVAVAKVKSLPPAPVVVKKKRSREPVDSSDDSYDSDAEYRPKATKQRRRSTKKSVGSSRSTRASASPPKRKFGQRRESLFACRYCDFKTETIGTCAHHFIRKYRRYWYGFCRRTIFFIYYAGFTKRAFIIFYECFKLFKRYFISILVCASHFSLYINKI